MADVTIPELKAKWAAAILRAVAADTQLKPGDAAAVLGAADLLDPQPPSLREQVAEAIHEELAGEEAPTPSCGDCPNIADAVLAVVADWLAAQPLALGTSHDPAECVRGSERDHDVRLLRGRS